MCQFLRLATLHRIDAATLLIWCTDAPTFIITTATRIAREHAAHITIITAFQLRLCRQAMCRLRARVHSRGVNPRAWNRRPGKRIRLLSVPCLSDRKTTTAVAHLGRGHPNPAQALDRRHHLVDLKLISPTPEPGLNGCDSHFEISLIRFLSC